MGIVAEPRAAAAGPVPERLRVLPWGVLGVYVALVTLTAARHEPWADEAQSWLLARDSGLFDLWTRLMHYEGSPGLWQSLLHVLTRAGLPYSGIGFVSAALGSVTASLLVLRSPFPVWVRVTLPFTFFVAYQYAVVARSYALLPPLVFACAALYPDAGRKIWWLTGLLLLAAAVSVHGFVLSAAMWLAVAASVDRRTALRASAVYFPVLAVIAWSAWPSADGTFVTRPDTSVTHFVEAGAKLLRGAFTGEAITSALAIGLSIPFLRKGGGLTVFVLAVGAMCSIAGLLYAQVWHQGLPLLAWLSAMWLAACRTKPGRAALASLALVIVPQCWWTIASVHYDWHETYSAGGEAAGWLRESGVLGKPLFAIGYATTAVQPYFARNIFSNVNGGSPVAYWDWSVANQTNRSCDLLNSLQPDHVLVGYKNDFERGVWSNAITSAGYGQVGHFEGNTFWKTRIFEPESFDLYRRGDGPEPK